MRGLAFVMYKKETPDKIGGGVNRRHRLCLDFEQRKKKLVDIFFIVIA